MARYMYSAYHLCGLIREETDRKGISISEFARRMGISERSAFACYYCNCTRNCNQTIATIEAIANAIEVDINTVFNACILDRKENHINAFLK